MASLQPAISILSISINFFNIGTHLDSLFLLNLLRSFTSFLTKEISEVAHLTENGLPPFLVPPTMSDFLPFPLVVWLVSPCPLRSIFWRTPLESGSPASCADGSYCTPASRFHNTWHGLQGSEEFGLPGIPFPSVLMGVRFW